MIDEGLPSSFFKSAGLAFSILIAQSCPFVDDTSCRLTLIPPVFSMSNTSYSLASRASPDMESLMLISTWRNREFENYSGTSWSRCLCSVSTFWDKTRQSQHPCVNCKRRFLHARFTIHSNVKSTKFVPLPSFCQCRKACRVWLMVRCSVIQRW